MEKCAMGLKQGAVCKIIELASIAGLKCKNITRELSLDVGIEEGENMVNLRLATNRKGPYKMHVFIKNYQIILIARDTKYRTSP
jgi:hypothetical protein